MDEHLQVLAEILVLANEIAPCTVEAVLATNDAELACAHCSAGSARSVVPAGEQPLHIRCRLGDTCSPDRPRRRGYQI